MVTFNKKYSSYAQAVRKTTCKIHFLLTTSLFIQLILTLSSNFTGQELKSLYSQTKRCFLFVWVFFVLVVFLFLFFFNKLISHEDNLKEHCVSIHIDSQDNTRNEKTVGRVVVCYEN